MKSNFMDRFTRWRTEAKQAGDDAVVRLVERILTEAARSEVSDVHFQPGKEELEVRFRTDGVLHRVGLLPSARTAQTAARLKVLADLLTYKTNVPQEGRVRSGRVPGVDKEMRISTAPTLYGERVVVRFFSDRSQYRYPDQLGLPDDLRAGLLAAAGRNSGAILLAGPAGSGKTTTAYALLRELADRGQTLRSIVTLEDPIEHALDRIAQIEITQQAEIPLDDMIQYMMRQDPEVLFVGEIRGRRTAETALQAALTGHLLLTTFHAGSAVDAVGRLGELGIEPFILRSSLSYVLCQRLLRKLCRCAVAEPEPCRIEMGGKVYELTGCKMPCGCPECGGTGYSGRVIAAEALPLESDELVRDVLDRKETAVLREAATRGGMISIFDRAAAMVETGTTSPLELRRVFG